MSHSVWYLEIERGFSEFIKKHVKVSDHNGRMYPIKVIPVKPHDDFNQESYPVATVAPILEFFATSRYCPTPRRVPQPEGGYKLEEAPLPYDIYFHIEFWTDRLTDMNLITRQWAKVSSVPFNLDVIDAGGNPTSVGVFPENTNERKDEVKGNKRMFRAIMVYQVEAWIYDRDEIDYTPVLERDFSFYTDSGNYVGGLLGED